jgi:hypothetical protein
LNGESSSRLDSLRVRYDEDLHVIVERKHFVFTEVSLGLVQLLVKVFVTDEEIAKEEEREDGETKAKEVL